MKTKIAVHVRVLQVLLIVMQVLTSNEIHIDASPFSNTTSLFMLAILPVMFGTVNRVENHGENCIYVLTSLFNDNIREGKL